MGARGTNGTRWYEYLVPTNRGFFREALKFSEPSYQLSQAAITTSTNHLATTMNISHKHHSSEVNRDMSESMRSAKKYRAEVVGPQMPPGTSVRTFLVDNVAMTTCILINSFIHHIIVF